MFLFACLDLRYLVLQYRAVVLINTLKETALTTSEAPLPEELTNIFPKPIPTWSRMIARTFDLLLETYFVYFVTAYTILMFKPDFTDWLNESYNIYVLNLALQPVVCLLDALIFKVFGNTPGKAIMGFSVAKETGEKLSFKEYFVRNFKIWSVGSAYSLPLYTIIANVAQYNSLKKNRCATYDKELGYVFKGDVPSIKRTVLVFVVGFVLMIAADVFSDSGKNEELYEMEESSTTL